MFGIGEGVASAHRILYLLNELGPPRGLAIRFAQSLPFPWTALALLSISSNRALEATPLPAP